MTHVGGTGGKSANIPSDDCELQGWVGFRFLAACRCRQKTTPDRGADKRH